MIRTEPDAFPRRTAATSVPVAIEWAAELVASGIASSSWASEPPGLVFTEAAVDGRATGVRITGGVPGRAYRVRNTITTAAGDTHVALVRCETVL